MSKTKLLVIEGSEPSIATIRPGLEDEFEIITAGRHRTPWEAVQAEQPQVILLDLGSSQSSASEEGLRFLRELRLAGSPVRTVVVTGSSDRPTAMAAVRRGAFDVLAKPLDLTLLRGILRRGAWVTALERDAEQGAGRDNREFEGMAGTSQSILRIFEAIRKVATTDVPLLISGESGTGKELTARAIHDRSLRAHAPFVPINCGAIPEGLLDAELFGMERAGNSGPVVPAAGKIEAAQGGTLFLDEVEELPPALQVKLLRCLQDRTFERVGGRHPVNVNVRIIAGTNLNLKEAIEKGSFREDLYYRLAVVHINLPPLRERGEDVVLLATIFLRQAAAHHRKHVQGFTKEAVEAMRAYAWPGNVRELSSKIGRAVVMAEGTHVTPADLEIPYEPQIRDQGSISLKVNQQRIETDLIMKAFTLSHGNLSRAAQELGISRSTLYRRLRQYGMDRTSDSVRMPEVSH